LFWVYERSVLHCMQHSDGPILGVFVARKMSDSDAEGLTRLLEEFAGLKSEDAGVQAESQ